MNFEKKFLQRLKLQDKNWHNGDKEKDKTAKFVNDELKIAVGLIEFEEGPEGNLKRPKEDAELANKEFKKHKDYKTILLIKCNKNTKGFCQALIELLQGPDYTEIGAYLILTDNCNSYFYAENPCAKKKRKVSKKDCEKYTKETIKNLINSQC